MRRTCVMAAGVGPILQQLDLMNPVLEPLVDRFELARQHLGERHVEGILRIHQADELADFGLKRHSRVHDCHPTAR